MEFLTGGVILVYSQVWNPFLNFVTLLLQMFFLTLLKIFMDSCFFAPKIQVLLLSILFLDVLLNTDVLDNVIDHESSPCLSMMQSYLKMSIIF